MVGGEWSRRASDVIFLSDDEGTTWRRAVGKLEPPAQGEAGLQEPGVVELVDGSLFLWARTDLGCQYVSRSGDLGEHWEPARPSQLASPLSPASIKRIPDTGDLLLVWNDHSGRFPFPEGRRTPLSVALSNDEARSWHHVKLLEADPDGWYCYTAIHFVDEHVLLGYCAGDSTIGGLNRLRVVRLPVDWLYGEG